MDFESLVRHARQYAGAVSQDLRQQLAAGQNPQALFICCSDSRVIPAHMTNAPPGSLFELRTAGNVVPEYTPYEPSSEMATIEYAVQILQVPNIVVCGHSHCGAVTALTLAGRGLESLPAMRNWLGISSSGDGVELTDPAVRAESKQHVLNQLRTLREYPFVRARVEQGLLQLHGWFYEIDTGLVYQCPQDDENGDFLPL